MPRQRARRGSGHFEPYGKGWRYFFSLGVVDGKRVRKSVTAPTQRECIDLAAKARDEVTRNLPASATDSLGVYLDKWLRARAPHLRPRTLAAYRGALTKHVIPSLGPKALSAVTHRDVERMMAGVVAKGRSARMANICRTVLGTALRDAQRDGLIQANPVSLARALPARSALVEPLTAAEAARLLKATEGSRSWPAYVLALNLGLRQGELLALRWQDVDEGSVRVVHTLRYANGLFTLDAPKTAASQRLLPLTASVKAALAVQKQRQEADRKAAKRAWHTGYDAFGLVFRNRWGRPVSGKVLTRQFQDDLTAAGLPGRRFHDLRHTCATFLLAQGVDIKVIQTILGHSTIAVTANVYAKASLDTMRDALGRFDGLVRK